MQAAPFTLLDGGRPVSLPARVDGERVLLAPEAVEQALGWSLAPEGLCGHGLCVSVPAGATLAGPGGVDQGELARLLDRPLALDPAERAACLGAGAADRAAVLGSLGAPDLRLPDLEGRPHALRDHRGRKVLLVAWASPHQFTIRRGTMPLRGLDPMGPEFRARRQEWVGGGRRYYEPLPC